MDSTEPLRWPLGEGRGQVHNVLHWIRLNQYQSIFSSKFFKFVDIKDKCVVTIVDVTSLLAIFISVLLNNAFYADIKHIFAIIIVNIIIFYDLKIQYSGGIISENTIVGVFWTHIRCPSCKLMPVAVTITAKQLILEDQIQC